MFRHEIRLSGSGGQGMITAGIILAAAAAVYENKNAVQSQSYGPEARGGSSKAEVIISDGEINFPKIVYPDVLVALTAESYEKYAEGIKDGGIIIADSLLVPEARSDKARLYCLPLLDNVTRRLGTSVSLNVAVLGALNFLYPVTGEASLLKSILSMIPKGAEDINRQAFGIGAELAAKGADL